MTMGDLLKGLAPPTPAAEKTTMLTGLLETLQKREELKREFAKEANEYYNWFVEALKDIDERFSPIDGTEIGQTKESIEKYGSLLDKSDEDYTNLSTEKNQKLEDITTALEGLGVPRTEDNEYTYWDDAALDKMNEDLQEALKRRREAFEQEEEVLGATDELEKQYADIAKEFIDYCIHMRHLIEEGEDTPDETREKVKEEWNERKPIEEKYAQCEELDKQLKEKDVKTNKYTTTTITQLKTVHMNPTIAYVEGYLEQGEDDNKMLEDLKYSAEELVKWIREVAPRYEEYEFNNDLDTTLEKYQELRKYRSEEKPPKEKDYKKIIALREAINQFNETQKRKPFVPEEGSAEAVFEEEWEKLQEAVLQYEEDLREEIRRLLELENLVQHFNHEAGELIEWIVAKNKFLSDSSHQGLNNKGAARSVMAEMAMFESEYQDRQSDLDELTTIGSQISSENYNKFNEVQETYVQITTAWAGLKGDSPREPLPEPSGEPKRKQKQ